MVFLMSSTGETMPEEMLSLLEWSLVRQTGKTMKILSPLLRPVILEISIQRKTQHRWLSPRSVKEIHLVLKVTQDFKVRNLKDWGREIWDLRHSGLTGLGSSSSSFHLQFLLAPSAFCSSQLRCSRRFSFVENAFALFSLRTLALCSSKWDIPLSCGLAISYSELAYPHAIPEKRKTVRQVPWLSWLWGHFAGTKWDIQLESKLCSVLSLLRRCSS